LKAPPIDHADDVEADRPRLEARIDFEIGMYVTIHRSDCSRSTPSHFNTIAKLRDFTLIGLLGVFVKRHAEEPRVFAAASLTNALTDVGAAESSGHPLPISHSRHRRRSPNRLNHARRRSRLPI
jgi:hypothetical protein